MVYNLNDYREAKNGLAQADDFDAEPLYLAKHGAVDLFRLAVNATKEHDQEDAEIALNNFASWLMQYYQLDEPEDELARSVKETLLTVNGLLILNYYQHQVDAYYWQYADQRISPGEFRRATKRVWHQLTYANFVHLLLNLDFKTLQRRIDAEAQPTEDRFQSGIGKLATSLSLLVENAPAVYDQYRQEIGKTLQADCHHPANLDVHDVIHAYRRQADESAALAHAHPYFESLESGGAASALHDTLGKFVADKPTDKFDIDAFEQYLAAHDDPGQTLRNLMFLWLNYTDLITCWEALQETNLQFIDGETALNSYLTHRISQLNRLLHQPYLYLISTLAIDAMNYDVHPATNGEVLDAFEKGAVQWRIIFNRGLQRD